MPAYYNEFKPEAAAMLRQLIADGIIAPGDVDERSIEDVHPTDLIGYDQCHFFAGIGGWSVALRLAMWPDNRPVWTGSCPCQPFSSAGKQKGHGDERHLWPHWARLIRECRPATIFGEQVAGAVAFGWWDDVATDLEAQGYACAAAVLPACSVGKPHKRDRLWFVANASGAGLQEWRSRPLREPRQEQEPERHGALGNVADSNRNDERGRPSETGGTGQEVRVRSGVDAADSGLNVADTELWRCERQPKQQCSGILGALDGSLKSRESVSAYGSSDVADTECRGRQGQGTMGEPEHPAQGSDGQANQSVDDSAGLRWISCPDGKQRPVVSDLRGLVNGLHDGASAFNAISVSKSEKEVRIYAASKKQRPEEVMREVRNYYAQEAVWKKPRGFFGISEEEILRPYLCELDRRFDQSGLSSAIKEITGAEMRSVRLHPLPSCTPQGWGLHQQQPREYPNSMHALSRLLAQHARQAFEAMFGDATSIGLLAHGVQHRAPILHGFGNAIVPQVAAAFIEATDKKGR